MLRGNVIVATGPLKAFTQQNVLTKNSHQYKFYPVKGCLEFKVRATKDAHIAFTSGPQATEPITELIIGGWGNTKSVIRRNKKKLIKVEKETINILDSDDFRGFWVQWRGSTISVGHENETESFLSWTDPEPFPINFVGLYTGLGCTGSWKIEAANIPSSAFPGGKAEDGEPLFIGRVHHEGCITTGMVQKTRGRCYISFAGRELDFT
ncbi:Farnesoic acid O-methyltransferase, partial [Operophtera brumata]